MRIVLKIKRGFWFFKRHIFYLFDGEDLSKGMPIMEVDEKTWKKFNVGDYFDDHYHQFYTKEQGTVNVK